MHCCFPPVCCPPGPSASRSYRPSTDLTCANIPPHSFVAFLTPSSSSLHHLTSSPNPPVHCLVSTAERNPRYKRPGGCCTSHHILHKVCLPGSANAHLRRIQDSSPLQGRSFTVTMQYVRNLSASVSSTWNSINPATLSGAIDVIVVEQEDGTLACSPFHVRFGKFSLLRPYEKKVEFKVNGVKQDYSMKLGEEGEAFFVFETSDTIPRDLQTSPLVSPASSPPLNPENPSSSELGEPDLLDLDSEDKRPRRPPPSVIHSATLPRDHGWSLARLLVTPGAHSQANGSRHSYPVIHITRPHPRTTEIRRLEPPSLQRRCVAQVGSYQ